VEPGDDMISDLLAAEIDGEPVDLLTILGYAFVMIAGGNDTTTGLLGGSAVLLTERLDERARLVDDPSLIAGAVEECLRLTSPVQGLGRTTTRDVVIAGTEIAAGCKVHLLYASANRDPRQFGPDADRLDVTRSIPACSPSARAALLLGRGGGPAHGSRRHRGAAAPHARLRRRRRGRPLRAGRLRPAPREPPFTAG
jgi:cytochrome P450